MYLGGFRFGARALYEVLKKRFGDQKLGFILATHFAQGFEDEHNATEEERRDVLRRWADVPTEMKPEKEKGKKKGKKSKPSVRKPSDQSTTQSVSIEPKSASSKPQSKGAGAASPTKDGRVSM